MISICPFSDRHCRGPACPLLCYLEQEGGRYRYYCGLNSAIPKACIAEQIIPSNANHGKEAQHDA